MNSILPDLHKKNKLLINANIAKNQEELLQKAVLSDNQLTDIITKSRPEIDTKTRIIDINNQEFRNKELLINRLTYIIYFIIYLIGLGAGIATSAISIRMLVIGFLIGVLCLLYALFMSAGFWKIYGDTSIGIAKGITKSVIDPSNKCQCYETHKSSFPESSSYVEI